MRHGAPRTPRIGRVQMNPDGDGTPSSSRRVPPSSNGHGPQVGPSTSREKPLEDVSEEVLKTALLGTLKGRYKFGRTYEEAIQHMHGVSLKTVMRIRALTVLLRCTVAPV